MGMNMEDLIQALMGGGAAQPKRAAGGDDPLAGILGSILGGGAAQRPGAAAPGGDLSGLLEAFLGGGAAGAKSSGSAGGLMDILGAVMGGSGGMQGAGASPLVEGIAGKLGLPQGIAQMIVAFVVGKLLSGLTGGGAAAQPAQPARAAAPQQSQGLNLDSLLQTMGQDRGMADELAQQTGLDAQTAQRGLQEVLNMIGAQGGAAQSKQGGLDNLLDNW